MGRQLALQSIKVLHVYKTSIPQTVGGVEVFIDTLCRTAQRSTSLQFPITNRVLSLAKKVEKNQPIISHGYPVFQVRENFHFASTGFSFSAIPLFSMLAAQSDVIHYHFPNPFADFLHFTCRVKKPAIVTYHSDIIRQKKMMSLYRPMMNRFLDSMKYIVATSPQYPAGSPVLQCHKKKVRVIPIGLDKAAYPVPCGDRLAHWKHILPGKFFLFIGVLRYYKGLHILLEALKEKDFHLVIAGTGNMEASLKKQCRSLHLSRVHFVGQVSDEDKSALFHLCHAFVFPSCLRSEAFGISLLEAAMHGKPLISAEIGTGTSFINIHGKTGLVVPPGNPGALGDAMEILYRNPSLAEEFGKNAQQRYEAVFGAEKQAQAYAELYGEALS